MNPRMTRLGIVAALAGALAGTPACSRRALEEGGAPAALDAAPALDTGQTSLDAAPALDTGETSPDAATHTPDAVGAGADGVGPAPTPDRLPASTEWAACGTLAAALTALAHSPDGQLLAIGRGDGSVDVVRVADGKLALGFKLPHGPVDRVAFTDDALRVAALGGGTLRIISVDGTAARDIVTGLGPGRSLQFSRGASPLVLAAGEPDGVSDNVELWRADDGQLVQTFAAGPVAGFGDGGASVLLTQDGKGVTVAPLDGGARRTLPVYVNDLTLSPDGTIVAGTKVLPSNTSRLIVVSLKNGLSLWSTELPHHWSQQLIFLSGRLMVLSDEGVSLFGIADGAPAGALAAPVGNPGGVRFVADPSPDDASLAVADVNDGRLARLSLGARTFEPAPGGWYGLTAGVLTFAATRDGRTLAASASAGRTWLLSLADASLRYMVGAETAFKPEFSPDGSLVALGGDARKVFRMSDGELVVGIPPSTTSSLSNYAWPGLTFSADAKELASGNDGHVELYALDGSPLGTRPSRAWAPGVAFSRDGAWMATSGPELWRADTGARVWPADLQAAAPDGTPSRVFDDTVAFTPDGSLLLISTASTGTSSDTWQTTTRLVRVADGTLVRDFGASLGRRPSLSADGAWLVAGTDLIHLATDTRRALDQPASISIFLPDGRIAAAAPGERFVRLYCPRRMF
jgi:WD40 repeat protein